MAESKKGHYFAIQGPTEKKIRVRLLFSSPEHEVLMVSYCDQSLSVVRRVSCAVNNLF